MNEAGIQAYFHRVHLSTLLKKIYLPRLKITFCLNRIQISKFIKKKIFLMEAITSHQSSRPTREDSLRVSVCKIQFKSCEQHAAYKLNKPSDLQ